eukprot:2795577-Amphidinium_carterae.1
MPLGPWQLASAVLLVLAPHSVTMLTIGKTGARLPLKPVKACHAKPAALGVLGAIGCFDFLLLLLSVRSFKRPPPQNLGQKPSEALLK